MEIQGSHKFAAPPQQVWSAMTNPATLKESIPGAESVAVNNNSLDLTIKINTPFFSGSFSGTVQIVSMTPPSQMVLGVDRTGSYGTIKGQTTVDLAADGAGTNLTYTAKFDMDGKIGMVPGIVMEPALKQGLNSFFNNLDKKM